MEKLKTNKQLKATQQKEMDRFNKEKTRHEQEMAKIVAQQAEISNDKQTQTILNTLGRFVAWAGSGTQAGASVTNG